MPKGKTSIKEIVINVVLLAVAGGLLMWRVNDCKQKEKQAQEYAQELKETAKKELAAREKACLESVPEPERSECIQCTCTACLDAFESCNADKNCRTMSINDVLKDGGPSSEDPARIRFENRASCMLEKCGQACTGKK